MNTNPPRDDIPLETEEWKVIHINRRAKTCLIRKGNKGESYTCTMADWLSDCIMLQDYVDVQYNAVSREWMVTDYRINVPLTAAIHNSYQEELPEAERDYIYNEKGELYE